MIAARPALSRRLRMMGAAISIGAASMLSSAPAFARGPDGIADIAEKVIDAVVIIDELNNVIFFNTAAEKLWGHSRAEVLGKNVRLLVPQAIRPAHDLERR